VHRITRDHIVYSLDRAHPPILEIDPGDVVCLETYDARTGTVRSSADLLERPHPKGSNPATGPIFVRGAEPGDSLVVTIQRIALADQGYLAVKAGEGLLAHRAKKHATRMIPIRDGMAVFSDCIRFPTRPMVGVIGTAPAGEGVSTGVMGPHGGNLDNRFVGEGAKVHLPVNVRGALLGIGDIHGAMGDGEISFSGLEICAEVTARVDLVRGRSLRRPRIETADAWMTTGDALDLTQAARIAADEMADLLMERLGVSFEEAYMLITAAVDVQISQCCEPGSFPATARAVVSKALLGEKA
jgi:amidase